MTRFRPALYRDGWFWTALGLGLCIGWLLPPVPQGVGITHGDWRQLAWLGLLYPAAEEWFFRGVIQGAAFRTGMGRKSWAGLSVANGAASLLFVAAHFLTHAPLWAMLVAVPSLLFGWFRDRYDSIIPGLILHCCYNLAYFAPLPFGT